MKPFKILGVRNRTLMDAYGIIESYCKKIPGSDCQIKSTIEFSSGFSDSTGYGIEDRKLIRVQMEKELREGRYNQVFFDAVNKTYRDVVLDIKSFSKTDFSQVANKDLLSYFDRFFQIYIAAFHPMVLAIYASDLQDIFDSELKAVLKPEESSAQKIIEYTALLLTPSHLTKVQAEEQSLFDIKNDFLKKYKNPRREDFVNFCKTPEVQEQLQKLVDSFGWFHMEFLGEPRTAHEYSEQIWALIESHTQVSPQDRLEEIVALQDGFLKKHPEAESFKNLVFVLQQYQIILDLSKADLVEGLFYARPLLGEIGRRTGLDSWIDVRFLTPSEIKDFLISGKKVNQDYITERKKHWTCVLENFNITMYSGEKAVEVADKLVQKEVITNSKEFKGITAYPGKVRGIACVLTSAAEKSKFKAGSILVTRDTTTELTSVIKNSIAIVADQGTLLSHTAIVSREFKIPCLIQTKIGTQLVKDGDELEVDADKGVVRIL